MGSMVMEPEDLASYTRIYHPGHNISTICSSIGKINSRGIFHNINPLDYTVPLLLVQLSLACLMILFTGCFLKPLGQPSMVIQIVGGLILGPSFLGKIAGFTASVYPFSSFVILDTLSVFGYIIYFFLIGVQMDPWMLIKIEKKDILIGISTVFSGLILSLSGAFILTGFTVDSQIASSLPAVATVSSVLSFPIIARYLSELKMVNSEFGRMSLASSLISNLVGFCIITLTVVTKQTGGEIFRSVRTFTGGLGFAVLIIFIVRPVILWALKRIPRGEPLKQDFIFMVLVGVLMSGFFSTAVGLNTFFGPLLYGIAIPAGPPLGSAMMEKLDLITSWLFMPLYFVKNGLVTDAFSVNWGSYLLVQGVILLACIGKFLGALVAAIHSDVPLREAIQIGLVVNVQGVLELGMFKMMKQNEAICEGAFVVLCLSMLIVTASVTPILRYLHDPLRRRRFHRRRIIMDLKPDSDLCVVVCLHDQESVPTFINLIEILNPTKRSPIDLCLVHLVELVGRAHPILIPHKLNKVNSLNAPTSKSLVNAFKNLQHNYHDGIMTVHAFTSISPYECMHDEVCEMAMDKRASLIITPFHKRSGKPGTVESSEVGIKIANDNLLAMAPCTTIIVVDLGPTKASLSSGHVCNVAVLFIGGPDDREAVAIGARMAGQMNVSLTIIRVVAKTSSNVAVKDSDETKFDNDVLNEFRSQLMEQQRFMYHEEEVDDGMGTVGVIPSIENLYELILVGRYHDKESPLMQGLSSWGDDSELGAIGDMFASADCDSYSTLLVVQQQQHWNSEGSSSVALRHITVK